MCILMFQTIETNCNNMHKYKFGDLVHFLPGYNNTGYTPGQVLSFDEVQQMYKVIFFLDPVEAEDSKVLSFAYEKDLAPLSEIVETNSSDYCSLPKFPKDVDEYMFYLVDLYNNITIRKPKKEYLWEAIKEKDIKK